MGKPSHKLGKCSITCLTEIDFGSAIGHYQQVKAAGTATPANAPCFKGDRGTSVHSGGSGCVATHLRVIGLGGNGPDERPPLALQLDGFT